MTAFLIDRKLGSSKSPFKIVSRCILKYLVYAALSAPPTLEFWIELLK